MSSSQEKHQKSSRAAGTNVPDLYRALGLEALEDDPEAISQAVARVKRRAESFSKRATRESSQSASSPRSADDMRRAERCRRVFQLAQHHLMDRSRKAAYDAAWRQTWGSAPTSVASAVACQPLESPTGASDSAAADWDLSALEAKLPAGDPQQAFDLARFLETTDSDDEFSNDRVLEQAIRKYRHLREELVAATAAVEETTWANTQSSASPRSAVETQRPIEKKPSATLLTRQAPCDSRSLASSMRRKRDQSLLMLIGGVLASLAILLSVLFYLLDPPQQDGSERRGALAANSTSQENARGSKGDANQRGGANRRRGSGLPQVGGLEGWQPEASRSTNTRGDQQRPQGDSQADAESPGSDQDAPAMTTGDASRPSDSQATGGDSMQSDPTTASNNADSAQPVAEVSPEEKEAWAERLQAIRQTLGEQDYETVKQELSAAAEAVRTPQQELQLERLGHLAQLAEEFHAALTQSIESMDAGEVFRVQSTEVAFVGSENQRVTIRMRGQNQSFALTEIPVGLALGIANLRLDLNHPRSLAQKAAFIMLHPNNNALALQRAEAMMRKAGQAGVAPLEEPTNSQADASDVVSPIRLVEGAPIPGKRMVIPRLTLQIGDVTIETEGFDQTNFARSDEPRAVPAGGERGLVTAPRLQIGLGPGRIDFEIRPTESDVLKIEVIASNRGDIGSGMPSIEAFLWKNQPYEILNSKGEHVYRSR